MLIIFDLPWWCWEAGNSVSLVLILLMCWRDKRAAQISTIHQWFDWLTQDSIKPLPDDNKLNSAIEKMLCHKRRESSLQCEPACTVLDTLSEQVMSGGHEKKYSGENCLYAAELWGSVGLFWLCTFFSPSTLWYSYSKYTFLLYWGFSDKQALCYILLNIVQIWKTVRIKFVPCHVVQVS